MKRLWSIFTKDMDHCFYTGSNVVERHHVFYGMGGEKKKPCEEYGYVIPLRPDLHPNGVCATEYARTVLDLHLKQECQRDFESKHGTREEFMEIFGRSYLDEQQK